MSLSSHSLAATSSSNPVPGRACGTCTLCCKTLGVVELAKPMGAWCPHCDRAKGCTIYDSRPVSCRKFYCQWMLRTTLGPEWKPERAKFALVVTATGHLTACVDPGFPSAWRKPPYYQTLKQWARQCADDPASAWPGVDVWIGPRCIVVLPDRDVDLGIVGADETVRVDRKANELGAVYEAQKFRPQTARACQVLPAEN